MTHKDSQTIHIIYAGGTFGCHGRPLNTLPKEQFLPNFIKLVADQQSITPLDNTVIKDSSTLTPADFMAFYQLIQTAYNQGARRFLLITGTDTLSFLAAFLSISLSNLPICVVVTGSMLPLFNPDKPVLERLADSDAWDNLQNAFAFINQHSNKTGVFISFYHQIIQGDSSQKIHTSSKNAFVGTPFNDSISHIYPKLTPLSLDSETVFCNIHIFYCIPNAADYLNQCLEHLLDTSPTAIILLGFGAGNIAYHPKLSDTLTALLKQGFLVISSSSCPFGAVSDTYAAGAWQYQLGVLSGKSIPLPTLYALALWTCLSTPLPKRLNTWHALTATWQ